MNLLTKETTHQQLFDHVAAHLRGMKERSMEMHTICDLTCAYRGRNGARCAIGACFDDEHYNPKMENKPAGSIIAEFFPDAIHLSGLVGCLQRCHDSCTNWTAGFDGEPHLARIAETFGLVYTPPTA